MYPYINCTDEIHALNCDVETETETSGNETITETPATLEEIAEIYEIFGL